MALPIGLWAQSLSTKQISESKIDYNTSFSEQVLRQALMINTKKNLSPMLDVGVLVPNGGIFRFSRNNGWKKEDTDKYTVVFKESPYQENSNLLYNRYAWYTLEGEKGNYKFDTIIEPLLTEAYKNHSRVILGLASMCGVGSGMSQVYNGRRLDVPMYLFKELQKSKYPMFEDDMYGKGYTANYDSPLLFKRYKALLKAFTRWSEGYLTGTHLKRKDLIYAIEMRYLGYWGEGSVKTSLYPKTSLIDKYLQIYIDYFPNTLLIGGGIELVHLPEKANYEKDKTNLQYITAMRHVYKLLTMKNNAGRIGLFIDSWWPYSSIYDIGSEKVLSDENGNILPLIKFLQDKVWGKVYITGEFDYFINEENKNIFPYSNLYEQFSTRHVSGIAINGFNVHGFEHDSPLYSQVFRIGRNILSMVGYRIVLGSPSINKHANSYEIAFTLTNIGVSRIFHDYYKLHLITKDEKGNVLNDYTSNLDLKTILPSKDEPLFYNPANGYLIKEHIPLIKGKLYLKIIDEKGVEYPMCLSNYGRQTDGSYYIGDLI